MSAISFGAPGRRDPRSRLRSSAPLGLAVIATIAVGVVAGTLTLSGHAVYVVAIAAGFIPVLIWKRPQLGPVVLISAALLVEQAQELIQPNYTGVVPPASEIPTTTIPLTNKIPLFTGLGSLHLEPADLLLAVVLIVYLVRCAEWGPRWWPSSQVAKAIAIVIGFVGYGMLIGQMHHGNLRESLQEVRPFIYLALCYLLTSVLVRSRKTIETMLWAFVCCEAFKALQGLYVFLKTRHWSPRPDAVLSHEEAFFFSVFILLVAALWLFDARGRLRTVATWLLPLIFFVDLVNNRRTAWLVLGAGLLTLVVVAYVQRPERRRVIKRAALVGAAVSVVYFPAFWNSAGTVGQPASAIKSFFTPDARDASSDLYRIQEDANLQYNIKQDGVLGAGFGVQIDYALPIVNIQSLDPYLAYIPHNGVLYVLMRLGILGAIAFWMMLAAGILAGCRLARAPDWRIAITGALSASALVGYALQGATDQGFYFYRIAFVTGCLMGMAEAARHIVEREQAIERRRRTVNRIRPAELEPSIGGA